MSGHEMSNPESKLREGVVWAFVATTVGLSILLLFLLPGLGGPVIVVFLPTLTAVALIRITFGPGSARGVLFSGRAWRATFKWLLISLVAALSLRLGVSLVGLAVVADYQWSPSFPSLLLIASILFAAGEEIGWRGFALPVLLARGHGPLSASLLLGVPWALLHLPLVLSGMVNAGVPMAAEFLIILALSVLLTWAYLGGGLSLGTAVVLHGGQNALAPLNNGLDPVASGWLTAAVYCLGAVLVVLVTRGQLGLPEGRVEVGLSGPKIRQEA